MTLTETQDSAIARATADTITPAPLFAAKCHLYKVSIPITKDTPLATLVAAAADYTGHTEPTITWADPTLSSDGVVEVLGTMTIFQPTGTTITNGIYGLFITDTAVAVLLFAGQFDNVPISMESPLDKLQVTIRYRPQTNSIVAYID